MKLSTSQALFAAFFMTLLVSPAFGQTLPARNAWGVELGAVNPSGNPIARYNGQWTPIGGLLVNVSLAQDGAVWGVNGNDLIYRWNGTGWDQMPGMATQVSAGSQGHVWAVSRNNRIWRWNVARNDWDGMPGFAKQVSVASDGAVWVTNPDDAVFRFDGVDWNYIPGVSKQVVAGSVNNVWRISPQNTVFKYNPAAAGEPWDPMPGSIKQITVAADGEAWGIGVDDNVYRWNGTAWDNSNKKLLYVSVGSAIAGGAGSAGGGTVSQSPQGKLEENHPALSYSGPWAQRPDAGASGGGVMASGQASATMTVRFTGDTIVIYRRLDTDGGNFNVRVDNKDCGSISSYFSERRQSVPAVLNGLGPGEHTLVLTVLGDRPAGSTGSNVYVDAVESPSPFLPNASQQGGVERLNALRTSMGLPPVILSPAINLAAQAHADYLNPNGGGHDQTPGTPGYIGARPSERGSYFGYNNLFGENAWPSANAAQMVDATLNSVWHRTTLVTYYAGEVGFGTNASSYSVTNIGNKIRPPAPAARVLAVYPRDNQTNVATSWDVNESPVVLPGKARPFGSIISLHITQPANVTRGTSTAPLTAVVRGGNGQNYPVYLLSRATEPQLSSSDYFIIPQAPLPNGMQFTVTVAGADEMGNDFTKEWKFTTEGAAALKYVSGSLSDASYRVAWGPAGKVVDTFVEYGPTTAYGTKQQGIVEGIGTDGIPSYAARIDNLAPGTYHYRVTATDTNGITVTSPNATFVMPVVATSISARTDLYGLDATSVVFGYSTNRAVASTEVEYGLTTAYGSKADGRPNSQQANYHNAVLSRLTPNSTYNYKIVAKDAQGNVVATTENRTFNTLPQ